MGLHPLASRPEGEGDRTIADVAVTHGIQSTTPRSVDHLLMWPVIVVLALMPLTTTLVLWWAPGGEDDPFQVVTFRAVDVALPVLVAVCAADAVERRATSGARRWSIPTALLAATVAWFVVAFLANSSWRGLEWFLRIAGTWAVAYAIRRICCRRQNLILAVVVGLSASQAALGIAQHFSGGGIGFDAVEWNRNWQRVGGATFGRGSFDNSYQLAALLAVSVGAVALILDRRPSRSTRTVLHAFMFLCGVGIALTFSRTVFFGILPIVCLLFLRKGRRSHAVLLSVGLALGIAVGFPAFSAKAEQFSDPSEIDSGRLDHAKDAALLVASEPLVGVGPGRYVIALRDVDYSFILAPPHNFAAHAAAEAGIPGGLLAVSTMAAFGLWLLRRSHTTMICGLGLIPFFFLDVFPYASPNGLLLAGLWLGLVWSALDRERFHSVPRSDATNREHVLPRTWRHRPIDDWRTSSR